MFTAVVRNSQYTVLGSFFIPVTASTQLREYYENSSWAKLQLCETGNLQFQVLSELGNYGLELVMWFGISFIPKIPFSGKILIVDWLLGRLPWICLAGSIDGLTGLSLKNFMGTVCEPNCGCPKQTVCSSRPLGNWAIMVLNWSCDLAAHSSKKNPIFPEKSISCDTVS